MCRYHSSLERLTELLISPSQALQILQTRCVRYTTDRLIVRVSELSLPSLRHHLIHKVKHDSNSRHTGLQACQIGPPTSVDSLTGKIKVHIVRTISLSSIIELVV